MKRYVCLLLCLAVVFLLSLGCFAVGLSIPGAVVADGDTVLQTFMVKDLDTPLLNFWGEWKESRYNFLLTDGNYLYCVIVQQGANVVIAHSDNLNENRALLLSNVPIRYMVFSSSGGEYQYRNFYTLGPAAALEFDGLVYGTYLSTANYSLPTLSYEYLIDYVGNLQLVDDVGEGGGEDGGGVLDWLLSFWEKFRDFLIGLFVPEAGYFEKWFTAIKDAIMEKLGPFASLYDALVSAFSNLDSSSSSSLEMNVPDNLYYPGYVGMKLNLLDGVSSILPYIRGLLNCVVVLLTAITCYRRVVTLFEV